MAFTPGKISQSRARPTMTGAYVLMAILAVISGLLLFVARNYFVLGGHRVTTPVLVTGGLGAGLAVLTWLYRGWARRIVAAADAEESRQAQWPDQPWKWKTEWQKPFLESDAAGSAAGLWIFAVLWNALSIPAAWIILHDASRKPAANVILLFPAVGLLVVWGAIYQTVKWRKFGGTRFVPSTLPGAIGGYLGGVIEVPARVTPETDAKLTLKCIKRETSGSGKQRHTDESVLWEHEEQIARDKWITGAGGTRIPVLFYIPADCTPTEDNDSRREIVWRLAASAAMPGVDFAVQFKVPVYVTGETAPPPAAGAPLLEAYSAPALAETDLAACGVRREGDAFQFSASHLPGMKITTAVLQLGIFGLLGWFWGRDIPGPAWGITIFIGLILSLFTGSVWFSRYELRIEGSDVVVTKPRPWGTKVARVARAEVKEVKFAKAMSSGESQYYSLTLVGADGLAPGGPVADNEPFLVRKLRYQLAQAEKKGRLTPEKRREVEAEMAAQLKAAPRFLVPFAAHIPGRTRAEAIGATVMGAIRGTKD